ncbi:MAG: hypothetical protein ACFUZC_18625 [Chthoniobacteraceae bacterium]
MKKRSLFWKITSRVFLAAIALVAIGLLVIAEENIRAKWLWDRYKRQAEARGERFDLAAFAEPAVPDEQNFYMTPLLKPVVTDTNAAAAVQKRLERFDPWGGENWPRLGKWADGVSVDQKAWAEHLGADSLVALKAIDPELDEISQASRRPFAQLPISLEMRYFHLYLPLRRATQIFSLRATARLDQGQSSLALEDVKTLFGISKAASEPPSLMSLMMEVSMVCADLQPVWEGLATHRWNDSQLVEIQQMLVQTDLLASGLRGMKGERAFAIAACQTQLSGYWKLARNVLYQNILALSRFYEERFFPLLDPASRVISPQALPPVMPPVDENAPIWSNPIWLRPYTFLFELAIPALNNGFKKIAYAQTAVDEARIGCALERYRLANGEYPKKLETLVPRFIDRLPWDIITGQPLHYERTADGLFTLYSVGWNGVDDHGAVPNDQGCHDLDQGDWVWRYPAARP